MTDHGDEADTIWSSVVDETRPIDLGDHLDLRPDRYEQRRVLGIGGMGEVTLVHDRRTGREIAIKTVRADMASIATRRAFVAEARMQAQLDHPSIIPVHEIGIDDHGREYFTMRAIAGTTLTKVLAQLRAHDPATTHDYPLSQLLDAFRRVCLVVEYAHEKGVIHRDLKPSNVMLGAYGEIYVLDWGLAQRRDEMTTDDDPSSPVLGTPGYIAPEQTLLGSQIDGRVDVYALGSILYEILSLQRLHQGRDSAEILSSTRRRQARVTAQQRAPEREIPPELDAVCTRATAFSPADRYPSVTALREDIDKYLAGHRDRSLREELAVRHAAAAEAATALALGPDRDAELHRRRALQDIARSLALDANNAVARRALIRLIAEPPQTLPADVATEIARGTENEGRFAFRLGAIAYASFAAIALITLLQGLRSWTGLAVVIASIGAAALWSVRLARKFRPNEALFVFTLSSIAITTSTGFYGPLVMVPVLAAANATAFNLAIVRRYRAYVFAIGCLVFLGPAIAEWVGLVAPFYAVESGRIIIYPRFIEFDETMIRIALVLVNIAAVVAPTIVVWKLADSKDDLRRKYTLQSWQLHQLVS